MDGQIVKKQGQPGPDIDLPLVSDVLRFGLETFVDRDFCSLAARAQASYEAAGGDAQGYALGLFRSFLECPMTTLPPPSVVNTDGANGGEGNYPFQGGQCPSNYTIEVQWTLEDSGSQVFTNSAVLLGPITRIFIIHVAQGHDIRIETAAGTQVLLSRVQPSNTYTSMVVLGVTVQAGQPDNCGSLDFGNQYPSGQGLGTPVPDGGVLAPDEILTFDVDVDGTTHPFSLPFKDIKFDLLRGICLTVEGIAEVCISPTGNITLSPPNGESVADLVKANGEAIEALQEVADEILEDTMCISEEICQQITVGYDLPACKGDPIPVDALGMGVDVVLQAMQSGFEGLNQNVMAGCRPFLNPQPEQLEALLADYDVTDANEAGFDIVLASDVAFVRVLVTVPPTFRFLYKGTVGVDAQGRFAQISVGYDYGGGFVWGDLQNQQFQEGVYRVELINNVVRGIRIASYGGVNVKVYDTGIRGFPTP